MFYSDYLGSQKNEDISYNLQGQPATCFAAFWCSVWGSPGDQPTAALDRATLDFFLMGARNPSPCTVPSQISVSGQRLGKAHLSPT